ncbi:MAG: NAD(P)-binding domain-containing protein [Tepidiformaceae bacterium]
MSYVTVIGLGAMGSALAATLLKKGHAVTVWNRTAMKAAPLVEAGATSAQTPLEAVAASPLTIVCVSNYSDSREVLDKTQQGLAGRMLIQLTTGSGTEATELSNWANGCGAAYLDGVILAYPSEIGGAETSLFVAGSEDDWASCEPVIRDLGGGSQYLGPNLRVPSTLDAALNGPLLGMAIGVIHGALMCESEGFPVAAYAALLPAMLPVIGHQSEHLATTIAQNRFGSPEAALNTYAAGLSLWVQDSQSRGINAEFPEFLDGLLKRAVAAGYGDEELSALIKLLR